MQQKNRVARSMLATVPMLVVGSLAMNLVTAPPAEAAPPRKAMKQRAISVFGGANKAVSKKTQASTTKTFAAPSSYRVVAGDTVSSIASKFGLATASVLALNGLGWKSSIYPGQTLKLTKTTSPKAAVAAAVRKYTVATGDTVNAIAKRFGVSSKSVLAANGLTEASLIFAGSALNIPVADAATIDAEQASFSAPIDSAPVVSAPTPTVTKYTIATGDTLTSIAKKFSVTVASILEANGLNANSLIFAGRAITIPTLSVYVKGRGTVTLLTNEMEANARIIVTTGRGLGVSDYGIVVALAAAMQESGLRNINYGDLDSIGLFQQRPSIGWGTPAQLLDPYYASLLFFGGPSSPNRSVVRGLIDVPRWQSMSVTSAAQAVQISAFPKAYAQWESSARFWLDQLGR